MNWFMQHYGDIIILSFVVVLIILCIKSLIDDKKKGTSCGMNCSVCTCGGCVKAQELKKKLESIN